MNESNQNTLARLTVLNHTKDKIWTKFFSTNLHTMRWPTTSTTSIRNGLHTVVEMRQPQIRIVWPVQIIHFSLITSLLSFLAKQMKQNKAMLSQ